MPYPNIDRTPYHMVELAGTLAKDPKLMLDTMAMGIMAEALSETFRNDSSVKTVRYVLAKAMEQYIALTAAHKDLTRVVNEAKGTKQGASLDERTRLTELGDLRNLRVGSIKVHILTLRTLMARTTTEGG